MSGRLSLYTKRPCPLCDEAAAILRRVAPRFGLAMEEVDIEGQPELWERYRHLIPVVALDGEVLLYPPITESGLREVLARRLGLGSLSRGDV